MAVLKLCIALDETFAVLTRLTDRAETEKTNLQSITLPANEKSLAYVQAILRHSLLPSKVASLVDNLKRMQFEIRACLEKLESVYRHVNDLYTINHNRLERVVTSSSLVSTSTMLTARIKLAGWLKRREGIWRLGSRSTSTKVRLQWRCSVFLPKYDFSSVIFLILTTYWPLALRHLLFVSKALYYAVVNGDSLWTTISFDADFFSHFGGRPVKQANRFTEQCLRCSRSRPLCIRIMCDDASDSELLAGPLQVLRNPKYRGSKRCTSLIWNHDHRDCPWISSIVALLPRGFPSLQHLSLSSFKDPIDVSQFPNCPVLERVEMLAHGEPYPAFWGTNFTHVTTLSFGNPSNMGWAGFDIATLSLFPVLRDLTLFTVGTGGEPWWAESQLIVRFQYLQILRVWGYIPPKVLTTLVAPALEELHIKANTIHRTSIASLWYSFEPLCQHLYSHIPETVSAEDPHWAADFTGLVEKCTRLKTLHISKWMEEECQKFIGHCDIVLY